MDSFKSEFQQENFEKIRDSIRQTLKKKIRPWYKTQATKINNDIDNIIFVPTTAITGKNRSFCLYLNKKTQILLALLLVLIGIKDQMFLMLLFKTVLL